MPRRRPAALPLLVALVFTGGVRPLPAQDAEAESSVQAFEARLVRSATGEDRLGGPIGAGLSIRVGLQRPVHLVLGYRFRDGGRPGPETFCSLFPEEGCEAVRVERDYDLHTADVGVGLVHPLGESLTGRLSLSGAWTRIRGEFASRDRIHERDLGSESQLGYAVLAGVERDWDRIALFVDGRFEDTWCGARADGELPCGVRLLSLEMGVALRYAVAWP